MTILSRVRSFLSRILLVIFNFVDPQKDQKQRKR